MATVEAKATVKTIAARERALQWTKTEIEVEPSQSYVLSRS